MYMRELAQSFGFAGIAVYVRELLEKLEKV